MSPEAKCILDVFRSRDIRVGGFIFFTDFGGAIVWEGGSVRDEPVREALRFLTHERYLSETEAGLELAQPGHEYLYPTSATRCHGEHPSRGCA